MGSESSVEDVDVNVIYTKHGDYDVPHELAKILTKGDKILIGNNFIIFEGKKYDCKQYNGKIDDGHDHVMSEGYGRKNFKEENGNLREENDVLEWKNTNLTRDNLKLTFKIKELENLVQKLEEEKGILEDKLALASNYYELFNSNI